MSRLRTSRPNWSVPRACVCWLPINGMGGRSRLRRLCLAGSCGARYGAATAATANTRRNATESAAAGLLSNALE